MVYSKAALAKQEKSSDVMIGHFLATAATRGNLYSRWTTVIMYKKNKSKIKKRRYMKYFGYILTFINHTVSGVYIYRYMCK